MTAVLIAAIVTALSFAAGALGLALHRLLPEDHSVEKSREMIGSVISLVTLLVALVLGTIVGSAYVFSTTQETELQALSAHAIQLDEALAQYGADAKPLRDGLKTALNNSLTLFWGGGGDADPRELRVEKAIANMAAMKAGIGALAPDTQAKKDAIAAANVHLGEIERTRLLMSLQLTNPFSRPLLTVVVLWACFLFCGFGLLSRLNATTVCALAFGAVAVGSAIFLILELSQPYTGLFRISRAALAQAAESIDR